MDEQTQEPLEEIQEDIMDSQETEETTNESEETADSPEQNVSHETNEDGQEVEKQYAEDGSEIVPYSPNLTYKFMGEEKQIPEMFKSLITSEESERAVRDYVERAEALPLYKERYSELQKSYEQVAPAYETLNQQVGNLAQQKENDLEGFLKTVNISDEQLFKVVEQKLKFMDLPKEQQDLYNRDRDNRARISQMEQQNRQFQEREFKGEVQARSFQLEQQLGKDDVKKISERYDSLYGTGAFRDEIVKLGKYEWAVNKRDISAAEAVQQIVNRAKPIYEKGMSSGTSQPKPKVIPNVRAGAAAPGKQQINSISDLKKLAQSRR